MKKSEIELIDLKEKIKKTEKEEDDKENYLYGLIFTFFASIGLAIFIWYKRIFDEYWMYGCGAFVFIAIISLLLSIFAYGWRKKSQEKLKNLKKQEKELVNSTK